MSEMFLRPLHSPCMLRIITKTDEICSTLLCTSRLIIIDDLSPVKVKTNKDEPEQEDLLSWVFSLWPCSCMHSQLTAGDAQIRGKQIMFQKG